MRNIISHSRAQRALNTASDPISLRERTDRIGTLTSGQVEAGLAWLAGYDAGIFDAVLDAATAWDDCGRPVERFETEPYCVVCGAQAGVFLALGDNWRHYRGDGKPEPYDAGHIPVVGWRPAAVATR